MLGEFTRDPVFLTRDPGLSLEEAPLLDVVFLEQRLDPQIKPTLQTKKNLLVVKLPRSV